MNDTINETFETFLKKNISAFDHEMLANHLKESEKKTTLLLREPKDLTGEHISILVDLIRKWNPEFNAQSLIETFITQN